MGLPNTLKIVHISSSHYADDSRILHKECRSLAKAGHDVTFVVRHDKDAVIHGIKIKALRSDPDRRLQRWSRAVWQAYREASRLKADVYHFHDPELIPVGMWLSLRGKRVIYDAHENLPKTFAYKYYIPRLARTGLGWLVGQVENLAVRRFTAVIAATPAIAKRFAVHNPRTVVVRNFPIPSESMRAGGTPWSERPALVVYVGSTGPERGICESVKAMSLLPSNLRARLAVAGPISPELRQRVAQCEGSEQSDLLGTLGWREVAGLLGSARVGLVPLHRMPNFIDSLPVKLFEYMWAGVPVVASDFPLWREIIEGCGCGLLVDPPDERNLARAIEHLLTHPDEAREMGQRGRAAVERCYNWREEEERLLTLYGSLTGEKQVCELAAGRAS